MSIENNLKRIADALEQIAKNTEPCVSNETGSTVAPAPAVAPAVVAMTPDQLNATLVEQFKRLGDRAAIDKVMTEQFNVQSIKDLPAEQYVSLIEAVKAIEV